MNEKIKDIKQTCYRISRKEKLKLYLLKTNVKKLQNLRHTNWLEIKDFLKVIKGGTKKGVVEKAVIEIIQHKFHLLNGMPHIENRISAIKENLQTVLKELKVLIEKGVIPRDILAKNL